MNRSRLALAVVAAVAACLPLQAVAAPTAYYNPATGGIHLKNDTGVKLEAIAIYSETLPNVAINDPSLYATIPGATFDPGDLPIGFTYLPFPETGSDSFGVYIGDVIVPGTPTSALTGVWYGTTGVAQNLPIIEIPEPAAIASAGIGFVVTVAAVRRRYLRMIGT